MQLSRARLDMGPPAAVVQGLMQRNLTNPSSMVLTLQTSCMLVNQQVISMLSGQMGAIVAQLQHLTSSVTELQG